MWSICAPVPSAIQWYLSDSQKELIHRNMNKIENVCIKLDFPSVFQEQRNLSAYYIYKFMRVYKYKNKMEYKRFFLAIYYIFALLILFAV